MGSVQLLAQLLNQKILQRSQGNRTERRAAEKGSFRGATFVLEFPASGDIKRLLLFSVNFSITNKVLKTFPPAQPVFGSIRDAGNVSF